MTNARVVLTTAGSVEEARKIAKALVERKLAACVNIVPGIESVYRWQGKIEKASEWLLVVKTEESAFEGVRATIEAMHSYETPECIALSVAQGDQEYLDWIDANIEL